MRTILSFALLSVFLLLLLPASSAFAENQSTITSNGGDSSGLINMEEITNQPPLDAQAIFTKVQDISNHMWVAALIIAGIVLFFKPQAAFMIIGMSSFGWTVINHHDTVISLMTRFIQWLTGDL